VLDGPHDAIVSDPGVIVAFLQTIVLNDNQE
jgi:hypothetical protein